jgi:dTMP kinase
MATNKKPFSLSVMFPMKGKLFVIDGTDASGKATQSKLLADHLRGLQYRVELVSFPRYDSFFGSLVGKYLAGEFGPKESLPPEFCALLYSLDRYDFKPRLERFLGEGKLVICDRYSAANFAHQAAKFLDKKSQAAFLKWIKFVESRLPKPTATIFLDMPIKAAQQLMAGEDRQKDYRQGAAKDLHEADVAYLERTRSIFLLLAKTEKNWLHIKCASRKGASWGIKPREVIHKEIIKALGRYL